MKRVTLFLSILLVADLIFAQDIAKKHGFNKKTLTLSKGKYEEIFTNSEVMQIGTVLINTKTNKVVEFLQADNTKQGYKAETSSRFLSIDPLAEKYPYLSPYVYCANNPIKYIDPDGRAIVLAGTSAQKQTILTHLQKLTNDKLGMRSNGTVIITRIGGENAGKTLTSGSSLVRDLNQKGDGAKTVTISVGTGGNWENDVNPANAINGVGSDATVNFDPTSNPSIPTIDPETGNVSGETRPNEIGLGNELIHADRSMKGVAVDYSTTGTHTYKDENGNTVTQTKPQEELETVGVQGNHKHNENKLRKEQGLNERGAY